MHIEQTGLDGVVVLTPARFTDARGFFEQCWSAPDLAKAGITTGFVQDNHSFSKKAGTVRGLHYQAPPMAQDKLVRCGRGALLDVAVDARMGSATYGQWFGTTLSFDNGKQMLVPAGFLHGFMTLTDNCEIIYKCSAPYAPDLEGGVAWDSLGISWPPGLTPILSDKDASACPWGAFQSPFQMPKVAA